MTGRFRQAHIAGNDRIEGQARGSDRESPVRPAARDRSADPPWSVPTRYAERGIQALLDPRYGRQELCKSFHSIVLGLDRDENGLGSDQRVYREEPKEGGQSMKMKE